MLCCLKNLEWHLLALFGICHSDNTDAQRIVAFGAKLGACQWAIRRIFCNVHLLLQFSGAIVQHNRRERQGKPVELNLPALGDWGFALTALLSCGFVWDFGVGIINCIMWLVLPRSLSPVMWKIWLSGIPFPPGISAMSYRQGENCSMMRKCNYLVYLQRLLVS